MKWFARGRLWESPEEERAASPARRPAASGAGPPGGRAATHEDPRERFKIPRDEKRRRFAAKLQRQRRDGETAGPEASPGSSAPKPAQPAAPHGELPRAPQQAAATGHPDHWRTPGGTGAFRPQAGRRPTGSGPPSRRWQARGPSSGRPAPSVGKPTVRRRPSAGRPPAGGGHRIGTGQGSRRPGDPVAAGRPSGAAGPAGPGRPPVPGPCWAWPTIPASGDHPGLAGRAASGPDRRVPGDAPAGRAGHPVRQGPRPRRRRGGPRPQLRAARSARPAVDRRARGLGWQRPDHRARGPGRSAAGRATAWIAASGSAATRRAPAAVQKTGAERRRERGGGGARDDRARHPVQAAGRSSRPRDGTAVLGTLTTAAATFPASAAFASADGFATACLATSRPCPRTSSSRDHRGGRPAMR